MIKAFLDIPDAETQVIKVELPRDKWLNIALETDHCTHSKVVIIAPSYSHTVLNRASRPHKVSKGGAEDCDAVKCLWQCKLELTNSQE